MKLDNGMDMHDPDMKKVLLAMHTEDPSRSVVLNEGFIAKGKSEAWYAPWDDTYRTNLDGAKSGWWDTHQGSSDEWYDIFYKDPRNFTYLARNKTEIVEWGEMEGIAMSDNNELMVRQIEAHGGASHELEDHKEILAAYNSFLTRWAFRSAFPTASQLFRSIARRSYESWLQYLENVRIPDEVDFAVISGWESTAIENHSGIVDNFRNLKGDPNDISGSLITITVRPCAKQRVLVVQAGEPALFDLYLLNDTNSPVWGRLILAVIDPVKAGRELTTINAPQHIKDQNSYLLKEAFVTSPLAKTGVYRFQFSSSDYPLSTQTREILFVNAKLAMPRAIRIGTENISNALRHKLEAMDKMVVEAFDGHGLYDLLVSSGLTSEALSFGRIGDLYGDEDPVSIATKAKATSPKIPGKHSDALLDATKSGMPLLVNAQCDELADGVAKQLAAAGAFTYNGHVGDFCAPWMGNWYFVRKHPVCDGLPQSQAMSVFFQAQGELSNGLLVDDPGVEIIAAYSRDHDRRIGGGIFVALLGKGRVLFQRVPDCSRSYSSGWLFNSIRFLAFPCMRPQGELQDMIKKLGWTVAIISAASTFAIVLAQRTPTKTIEKVYGAQVFPQSEIDAVKATGSGVSGPGKPIVAGYDLGQADGPAGSAVVTSRNRDKIASGSVVKDGLIPNIKPIWDLHMRDTQIILGPDGNYYMTGSTGNNIWEYNDGIELYKSPDLHHWTYMGLVWSIEKDGGWEKGWRLKNGRPIRSIWAPEIHYLKGNYYICFGMPPGGMAILKSTTGRPEGPYIHATDPNRPLLGGIGPIETSFLIDPTLFEDTDGKVYFTYGPAREIARMKDDLSGFAEPLRPVKLLDPDHDPAHHAKQCVARYGLNDIGFEGATLLKHDGKYYLGSTDVYEGRYTMMLAVSDNIYGPYRLRRPTVASNGGTGFFKGKDGSWYTSLFGDDSQAPWRSKPGILRVEFEKDGSVHVAKQQPVFILADSDTAKK